GSVGRDDDGHQRAGSCLQRTRERDGFGHGFGSVTGNTGVDGFEFITERSCLSRLERSHPWICGDSRFDVMIYRFYHLSAMTDSLKTDADSNEKLPPPRTGHKPPQPTALLTRFAPLARCGAHPSRVLRPAAGFIARRPPRDRNFQIWNIRRRNE